MSRVSRTLRLACTLALGGLLLSLVPLLGPAQAITSGYLCTGYTACKNAGYPHAGYAANNHRMYWRMYSGHNCTNYVAYRMVKAGMPNVRPWSGSGNATNWGVEMRNITDQQPRVGAVAWWRANVPGAGSAGHVAYVERVISPSEIVISEDSWGGEFHWRKLVKGTGWPTGFIHFIDKTIDNTTKPKVSGTPQVGVPLTATAGAWKPVASVRYQWLADGTPIAGATRATYVPGAAQRGHTVAVRVTATKKGFSPATLTVPTSAPVAAGVLTPVETPVVSGNPFVDRTLTATQGSWSPAPGELEIRWRADNQTIEGATGPTLTVTRALLGKKITAVSVARRDGYTKAVSRSAPTDPVVVGEIVVDQPFTAGGTAKVGSQMWIEPGTFTPKDATVAYAWLRDGVPIDGATTPDYVVTPADAGHRITGAVILTKPNYETRVVEFPIGDVVTTKPTMQVTTKGRRGSAIVSVRVVAPGVSEPDGRVTIRIGNKKQVVPLSDGRARVVIEGLRAKKHKVYVDYAGTDVVEAAHGAAYVRVR
ncbi:MAG TPA: CHAP domain-containing protein [Nocardioides sp.]|nr:CHAP domain-containing protein [Nocardioides sp.]